MCGDVAVAVGPVEIAVASAAFAAGERPSVVDVVQLAAAAPGVRDTPGFRLLLLMWDDWSQQKRASEWRSFLWLVLNWRFD